MDFKYADFILTGYSGLQNNIPIIQMCWVSLSLNPTYRKSDSFGVQVGLSDSETQQFNSEQIYDNHYRKIYQIVKKADTWVITCNFNTVNLTLQDVLTKEAHRSLYAGYEIVPVHEQDNLFKIKAGEKFNRRNIQTYFED